MSRNALSIAGRIVLSGLIAFVVLSVFCSFYSNTPVHYDDPDGATDYRWEANTFRSQWTEGFSYGKTNNEGYYDRTDYVAGEQIDVLLMGSSHMEAANVMARNSTAALLEQKLGDRRVYDIGVSGHYFPTCVKNLENALAKYKPASYVIIETGNLYFTDEELNEMIEGTVPSISSHAGGIVGMLQKNPFLRQLYYQFDSYRSKGKSEATYDDIVKYIAPSEKAEEADSEPLEDEKADNLCNEELLSEVLRKIKGIADSNHTEMIIMFHPTIRLGEDGTMSFDNTQAESDQYRRLCEECGIYYLDMSDRFMEEYCENNLLPYGFTNTSVGFGHLNKTGHVMIADELYKLISEVEK